MHTNLLKRVSLVAISSVLLFSFITKADKTNFSGNWALNEGKSELGDFGGRFAARTIKVDQADASITIAKTAPSFNGDDVTTTETLSFDGKVAESTVFNGMAKKKSTAKWSEDGKTFTISSDIALERNGETMEIKSTETWSLGADGMLVCQLSSSSPQGDLSMKTVYDKK